MEKMELKNIGKNTGKVMKAAAALVAAAAFVVASGVTPAPDVSKDIDSQVFNPPPVVMTIEEAPEAIIQEEEQVEEEMKKKGFFFTIKMAVYGFFAACTAWIAHKIPWKKIFNKRNFYILMALTFLGLSAYVMLTSE